MSYSKDALFLGELPGAECPEVDVRLATGDDVVAVPGVELHRKHCLVGALEKQHTVPLSRCSVRVK